MKLYSFTQEDVNAEDFYVWANLKRTIVQQKNVLTVRKLDGWKEVTTYLSEDESIAGFDIVPKEANSTPWDFEDQEISREHYLLTYTDTDLAIWDWSNGNLISKASVSSGQIRDVVVSLDGKYVMLTTDNGGMELWRLGTYKDIKDPDVIVAISEEKGTENNQEN